MDDREYFRTYSYLSASGIARWVQQGKPEVPRNEKFEIPVKAAEVGTALHALVLEEPKVAQQIIRDRCKHMGFSEWKCVNMMIDSVAEDVDFQELLKGCETELAMFYKGRGMRLKGKADAINRDLGYVLDLKTSSAKDFQKSIYDYVYTVQAALYPLLGNLITGSDAYNKFIWLVCSKRDGGTKVVEATKEQMEEGLEHIKDYFRIVKKITPFDKEVSDYVRSIKKI